MAARQWRPESTVTRKATGNPAFVHVFRYHIFFIQD